MQRTEIMTTGIIAEYNPFHNGHKYQINKIKTELNSPIICVMSGNFVQRGDIAVFDKWQRASMAIKGGASLVLELPTVFAVRSAEDFALGAVRLLGALGIVEHLCFGAENADLSLLTTIANAFHNESIISEFHLNLKQGSPYALALSKAINNILEIDKNILASPNNILGIEYLKALQKYSPSIKPFIIMRKSAQHHDKTISGEIASATAIRNYLSATNPDLEIINQVIPQSSQETIHNLLRQKVKIANLADLTQQLFYFLRTTNIHTLQTKPYINEGLEYKLHSSSKSASNIDELLQKVKSKRYPLTRLKRILIHCLLDTTKAELAEFSNHGPQYARVLAFDNTGRELIKHIKKTSTIPLITKTTHFIKEKDIFNNNLSFLQRMLAVDIRATDIYNLTHNKSAGADFITNPYYYEGQ